MKTVGIDTNVLVTLKLKREPGFTKAKSLLQDCLKEKTNLFIPLPAILETEWVLRSYYRQAKEKVVEFLDELFLIDNVLMDSKENVRFALNLYKISTGVNFTDCIILSEINNRNFEFLTFDKKLENLFRSL